MNLLFVRWVTGPYMENGVIKGTLEQLLKLLL